MEGFVERRNEMGNGGDGETQHAEGGLGTWKEWGRLRWLEDMLIQDVVGVTGRAL